MVVMRCISVQQIVRSDIQAGRKILQQLNRAAAASRFNFCKMVRTNVQHYTQLFLRNSLLFRKSRIRPPNSFASNRIVQSFPLRRKHKQAETPFPSTGLFSAWKCTMTATRWSCSCEQLTEYYQSLMHFRQFSLLRNWNLRHGDIIASVFITVKH